MRLQYLRSSIPVILNAVEEIAKHNPPVLLSSQISYTNITFLTSEHQALEE